MLSLSEVSVNLGGVEVLRRVSLLAPPGVIVGVVGRNGAGKTTLMRSIMGLLPLAGGRIELDGARLDLLAPHRRARLGIGYMPEDRRLVPQWTVKENLMLPLWAAGETTESSERLQRVFELVEELYAWRERKALELSGGQQKIVARGLLLLDEPFEGVAPALVARLRELIGKLKRERELAVLVTDSNDAHLSDLAERLYTIERGALTEALSPVANC